MLIKPINRTQLAALPEISEATSLFVLPGIVGEECLYQDHIGNEGFRKIKDFIENGGAYLGFCAGAYHAFSTISYEPPEAQKKLRLNTDRPIRGVAKGPIHSHYRPCNDDNVFADCTTIRVTVGGDKPYETNICYGNGPVLFPHDEEDYETLVRYRDIEGQPPAIIVKPFGRGLVIASGLVPQYGAEPVIAEKMRLNGQCPRSLVTLATELAPHEEGRLELMDRLAARLRSHWQGATGQLHHTGTAPEQMLPEQQSSLLEARHG